MERIQSQVQKAFHQRPITKNQIQSWLELFTGFKPSDSKAIEGHFSQLDYIYNAHMAKYTNSVVLAARGSGKSMCASAACVLDCLFKPGIKIAVAAWKKEQSDYIHNYIIELVKHAEDYTELGILKNIKADEILFNVGSQVRFFSGKAHGGLKGFHPMVLICDEGDLYSQEEFQGLSNSISWNDNFATRYDLLSTNYSMAGNGVVLEQIRRYEEYNLTKPKDAPADMIFKISVLDVMQKCDDRYDCGTCLLWKYCKGIAKSHSSGFMPVQHVLNLFRSTGPRNFESELLLLTPKIENAYFSNFSTDNISEKVIYDPKLSTFIMFDFGGSRNPHACVIIQRDAQDRILVIDEFTGMGPLENMLDIILKAYPTITKCQGCFLDPSGTRKMEIRSSLSYYDILKRYGFAPKFKQCKRKAGCILIYNAIKTASGEVKLLIHPKCKGLIQQIQETQVELFRGRLTDEPAEPVGEKRDDLLDCLRYGISQNRVSGATNALGGYSKDKQHSNLWITTPRRY